MHSTGKTKSVTFLEGHLDTVCRPRGEVWCSSSVESVGDAVKSNLLVITTEGNSTLTPTSDSTLMPTSDSTLKPTTGSTLMPTTGSTLMPTTGSTLTPTTGSTLTPTTGSTLTPTTGSTLTPTTGSTLTPSSTGIYDHIAVNRSCSVTSKDSSKDQIYAMYDSVQRQLNASKTCSSSGSGERRDVNVSKDNASPTLADPVPLNHSVRNSARKNNFVLREGVSRGNSPGTFFTNLRKEQTDSFENPNVGMSEDEWKSTPQSYFAHADEYVAQRRGRGAQGAYLCAPGEQAEVTNSTARRYSAVVQQFMVKNGLVTPSTEVSLLARQADQAGPSDPSYVSWGSVDLDQTTIVTPEASVVATAAADVRHSPDVLNHVNCTPGAAEIPISDDCLHSPEGRSAESFKLKSLFPPDAGLHPTPEPMQGLSEDQAYASMPRTNNENVETKIAQERQVNADDYNGSRVVRSTSDDYNGSRGVRSTSDDYNGSRGVRSTSDDYNGSRVVRSTSDDNHHDNSSLESSTAMTEASSMDSPPKSGCSSQPMSAYNTKIRQLRMDSQSTTGSPSLRMPPLSSPRRGVLPITSRAAAGKNTLTRQKIVAVSLIVVGSVMIVGSVIGLIILLA